MVSVLKENYELYLDSINITSEDFDFDEIDDDLVAFQEDETVQQALQRRRSALVLWARLWIWWRVRQFAWRSEALRVRLDTTGASVPRAHCTRFAAMPRTSQHGSEADSHAGRARPLGAPRGVARGGPELLVTRRACGIQAV